MAASPNDLTSTLTKLSINPSAHPKSSIKIPKPIADSWDEESSGSDTEPATPQHAASSYPSAPPPTPISPSIPSHYPDNSFVSPNGYGSRVDGASDSRGGGLGGREGREGRETRPDKTDAAAKRMIAGALGVRAPKKTEEQVAYEKALREKEVKRREREREEKEKQRVEGEKAKRAIWED